MERYRIKVTAGLLLGALGAGALLSGCGAVSTIPASVPDDEIKTGAFSAEASLHDPFIIEGEDGTYYCYGTHMTAATTKDLRTFKMWGDGEVGS